MLLSATTLTRPSYLESPIVEIEVGNQDNGRRLYAHQAILEQSPSLATLISAADSAVSPMRIQFEEDPTTFASALEYLYKGDYFPSLSGSSLESDPSIAVPDDAGAALLRHARLYTLGKTLGLPALAALAHRKIHLAESTARGEMAYARYVYAHTSADDKDVRRPVAQFWATRSHVLRHEAEADFRDTCLSYPQFGFDVLTMVLDAQERRSARVETPGLGPGRKRARMSQV